MTTFNNLVVAKDRSLNPDVAMLARYLSKLANSKMPEPEDQVYANMVFLAEALIAEPISRGTLHEMLATITEQSQLDI